MVGPSADGDGGDVGDGAASIRRIHVPGPSGGVDGTHLHALGSCAHTTTTIFGGAGSHHNPLLKQHGTLNPAGPAKRSVRRSLA